MLRKERNMNNPVQPPQGGSSGLMTSRLASRGEARSFKAKALLRAKGRGGSSNRRLRFAHLRLSISRPLRDFYLL